MAKHSLGRDDARPSVPTESPSITATLASAIKTDNPLVRAALKTCSAAHNCTNLAHSCFADLGTLFHAIADAADEYSQAAKLAKIGLYLTEDWAKLYDSEREDLELHITALREALGFPPIKDEGGAA